MLIVLATAVLAHAAGAQPARVTKGPPAGDAAHVFVMVHGADTLAVERVTAVGDSTIGDLRLVAGGLRVRHGAVQNADATTRRFHIAVFANAAPADAPPAQRITLLFDRDTMRIAGGSQPPLGVAAGTLPYLNLSVAGLERAVRRARLIGGDRVTLPMIDVAGARPFTVTVERLGPDSVLLTLPSVPMRIRVDAAGRLLGGAVPGQGITFTRLATLAATAGGPPRPDYSAPPGAPYTAEEVRVPTRGGFALAGTYTRPVRNVLVPAVVTITGSGLEDRDEAIPTVRGYRLFHDLADTLGRRGVAVLRLDDRGFGASGGDPRRATSADFADDVRAAIAWLRARPDVDPRRIALIGHSEGGMIAPMVAATDTALAGIVLMAGPSWTGRRVLEYQRQGVVDRTPGLTPARRDSMLGVMQQAIDSAAASLPWMRFFMDYDPLATARRVRAPVLVLQGATDRQVSAEQAEELSAALRAGGNAAVTTRVFPATNHLFLFDSSGDPAGYPALPDKHVRRDVLGAVADWLVARLRP